MDQVVTDLLTKVVANVDPTQTGRQHALTLAGEAASLRAENPGTKNKPVSREKRRKDSKIRKLEI
jgi:hypothetical protein